MDDALRLPFDGVEIYNHVCHWLNGKSSGLVHWDALLRNNSNVLAFAVDDAHLTQDHPGWNGGWIMVKARECSTDEIMQAIRKGSYYSSCGPEIRTINLDGNKLHLTTSPVQFVRIVGPAWQGIRLGSFDGDLLTDMSFHLPTDWDYIYVEVEDQAGLRAWTNSLFTDSNPSN